MDPAVQPAPAGRRIHYERRRPEDTVLYQLVQEHLETFLAQVERETGSGLPEFVKGEFEAFLQCGIPSFRWGRLWLTGRVSQTKYYLSNFPSKITVIRRHHPLHGRELEVLSAGKVCIVVRLGDGSTAKIPRRWTDADGTTQCVELGGDSKFSLSGLRELLKLVEALTGRRCPSNDACGEINAPHHLEGGIDAQTNVARVHRAGGFRGAVGVSSRAGAQRSDRALCAVDGADIGRAGDLCEGGVR